MPSGSSGFEQADDRNAPIIAQALSDQGEAALYAGDLFAAATMLQEAVARWRRVDEPVSLARALNNLAVTYARLKEPARAVPLLTEAVGLLNAAGDIASEATALNALGGVHSDLGNYSQAVTYLRAALPLRREAGDRPGEALTLDLLARVCSETGEPLQALGYRREQLDAVRATGNHRAEAEALIELGEVLSSVGYDAEAATTLHGAVDIYEQQGYLREAGETLLKLAQVQFSAGDMAATVAVVEKALPLLRRAGAWGPQAVQWESFLLSQRMQQQIQGALHEWKRGEPGGMQGIVEAVQKHLDTPGTGPEVSASTERAGTGGESLVDEQVLRILADAAARLAGTPPVRSGARLPSTDEIAAQDERSTPDLILALQSPEAPERRKAALALGVRGDLSAVEPLIQACGDRNQWVRMAAVRSLGKLKDARALEALCKRVEEDRDKEVRRSAAASLGALGDKRAVEALTVALTDPYFRTVESAEKALRKLKTTPNLSAFVALLTHKDIVRRYAAANRLAQLGDARAVVPLAREAENREQPAQVRASMLKALAALKDRRGVEAAMHVLDSLADTPEVESQAGVGKGMITPAAAQDALIKQAALEVIAAVEDPSELSFFTPRLVTCLDDRSPYVRHAAVAALGAVGDTDAIPALERIQQTDEGTVETASRAGVQRARLRSAAAEALSRIRSRYPG